MTRPPHDHPPEPPPNEEEDLDVGSLPEAVPEPLRRAFDERGYRQLTAVQEAVLADALSERDLRVSSQTGSGKTVAIGLAMAPRLIARDPKERAPLALVIVPTRELARQVDEELSWLLGHVPASVCTLSGGASYRDEHRALARKPQVIVATPGRLRDHMGQSSFPVSALTTVVLDEADQMLDLGFAEDLEAIFAALPSPRRTILVSATFPPEVKSLADRIQTHAAHVEGTRLGTANADIEHEIALVDPHERLDAIVNLLLGDREARTLVFTRTRAGAAEIAEHLQTSGFPAAHISGELAQRERTRTLDAFRAGTIRALVATDVAARGIDVPEVTLVVHIDAPTSSEAYTHRSGRTGRAGRRGRSVVLATLRELPGVTRVLQRAHVKFAVKPVPDADSLRSQGEAQLVATLSAPRSQSEPLRGLAARLCAEADPVTIVARLLEHSKTLLGPAPRVVRRIEAPRPRERSAPAPLAPRGRFAAGFAEPAPRTLPPPGPARGRGDVPMFVPFVVTVGGARGADPRMLTAMVCRRGEVDRRALGGIFVRENFSIVEIRGDLASDFARAASRPDPREPHVRIEPFRDALDPRSQRGPRAR